VQRHIVMKYLRNNDAVDSFIFILFLFVITFILVPSELYYHNISEWGKDYFLLLYFAGAGVLFSVCLYVMVRIIGSISKIEIIRIAYWLFVLGVFFLVSDIFAPLQVGLLDGSEVVSDQPLFYTLLEAILLLACIAAGVYFSNPVYKKLWVVVSIAVIVVAAGYLVYCVKASRPHPGHAVLNTDKSINRQPNIYHIVLDEMQTDYLLELVNHGYNEKLDGFYLFENNVANYPFTSSSSASYLSGTVFKGSHAYYDWLSQKEFTLFNKVFDSGYDVHIYAKDSVIQTDRAASYVSQDDILKKYTGTRHPLLKEFTRLWFARLAPNFMTNKALNYGSRLGGRLTALFDKDDLFRPRTIGEGIEPYAGVFIMRDMLKTEQFRPSHSTYLYAHPILPHGPYVFDAQCNYSEAADNMAARCLEQAECCLSLLIDFFEELKRLDRFDESIIVVHSDHGTGWAGFLEGNRSNGYYSSINDNKDNKPFRKDIHPWSKHHLESRSMALLMVKPPHSRSELRILDVKSQLMDVYPTVLDFAGLPFDEKRIDGLSLKNCILHGECNGHNDRERYFYYYSPGGPKDGVIEKVQIIDNQAGRPEFKSYDFIELKRQSVELGSHIYFSRGGDGHKYARKGWSSQEENHIWSEGATAVLSFKMSGRVEKPLKMKTFAMGLSHNGKDPQHIKILANGNEIGAWSVLEREWHEITIPSGHIDNDTLDIAFQISNPTAPCKIGNSEDCRELGIAVLEMVIYEQLGGIN
jgi:hypothetical protein